MKNRRKLLKIIEECKRFTHFGLRVDSSSNSSPSSVPGVYPAGFHVPGDAEWQELEITIEMTETEANYRYDRGTHHEGDKLKKLIIAIYGLRLLQANQ